MKGVGQMTQPVIAEPSDFSPEGEKFNEAGSCYAPFRRPAEGEVAVAPTRLSVTDAELFTGALLFGAIGVACLTEAATGQVLARGLTDRRITATRRIACGVIGAASATIASVAGFTLARRYAATLTEQLFYESISSALSSERDYADLLVGVYPC